MKRYSDCHRAGGFCGTCSLAKNGRDCHDSPLNWLFLMRTSSGLTQQELADNAGINIRQVQKFERGESDIENMTLKTAIAICSVLGCDISDICV